MTEPINNQYSDLDISTDAQPISVLFEKVSPQDAKVMDDFVNSFGLNGGLSNEGASSNFSDELFCHVLQIARRIIDEHSQLDLIKNNSYFPLERMQNTAEKGEWIWSIDREGEAGGSIVFEKPSENIIRIEMQYNSADQFQLLAMSGLLNSGTHMQQCGRVKYQEGKLLFSLSDGENIVNKELSDGSVAAQLWDLSGSKIGIMLEPPPFAQNFLSWANSLREELVIETSRLPKPAIDRHEDDILPPIIAVPAPPIQEDINSPVKFSFYCPKCHIYATSDSAKFCRQCGDELVRQDYQVCLNCSTHCPTTAKFCRSCGKPIPY